MGLHLCHWCSVTMCVPVKDELTEYRGAEQIVEKFLLIDITMILRCIQISTTFQQQHILTALLTLGEHAH